MYHLYYAGMPDEKVHEQIGLAISEDGCNYTRVHGDGLIIKRDEKLNWKNLRVCNPTVMLCEKKFIMFYQGISKDLNTSIGMAVSGDGINFDCEDAPCLTAAAMKEVDASLDETKTVRLTEPSVLIEQRILKMWFVYMHESHPGNAIYYAESKDGQRWSVHNRKLLSGNQFGDCNLHYPQVIRCNGGYEMWFTLRDNSSYVFGIFRMISNNGLDWKDLEQVLPTRHSGRVVLTKVSGLTFGLKQGMSNLKSLYRVLFRDWPNFYGIAHPHIIVGGGDRRVLYYHNANSGPRGLYYCVGRAELVQDEVVNIKPILSPRDDRRAWDAFFVADPYVVQA